MIITTVTILALPAIVASPRSSEDYYLIASPRHDMLFSFFKYPRKEIKAVDYHVKFHGRDRARGRRSDRLFIIISKESVS